MTQKHNNSLILTRALWPVLAVVVSLLSLSPTSAQAWWSGDWSFRKQITIDPSTAAPPLAGNPGRIPLLIRLHDGNFRFADAKEDGSDIRFVAGDDVTPLKFHIDTYDGLLGIALVWVDVPVLDGAAQTQIWMYFGNADAPAASDARGTYDADTTLVYHFSERGAAPQDQTAYGNTGQNAVTSVDNAIIGRGARLGGATTAAAPGTLAIPGSPSLALAENATFTFSAWVKPIPAQATGVLYSRYEGENGVVLGFDQGRPYVDVIRAGVFSRIPAAEPISPSAWHQIALTSGPEVTLYVDGRSVAMAPGGLPAMSGPATLGGDTLAGAPAPQPFDGDVDEVVLAKSARSPAYIAASFSTQGPQANIVAYGMDEEAAGWDFGYFGIILQSVTVDGWVVIAILMVMAVISILVMIAKARYISRTARANAKFLELFSRSRGDVALFLTQLSDNHKAELQNSVLYRLSRASGEELRARVLANRAGPLTLSPQALASIRSALDRVVNDEEQKLNAQIVLLTIAISGGPFLGLLGTVVGVMITFAAIAASGDVNINAIAPGIAAALVATVAGLAVAIPALFGYNYFVIRIKDITREMHVFVDELVTRFAEAYSNPERMAAE